MQEIDIWEQARSLPDIQAARLLGKFFREEWFLSLPEHEIFLCKRTIREIAYLNPAEADECIAWLKQQVGRHIEFSSEEIVDWDTFVSRLAESVAEWGRRSHALSLLQPEARQILWAQIENSFSESAQRDHEEAILILAEAILDPVPAAALLRESWQAPRSHWKDPWVAGEVALKLWKHSPQLAVELLSDLMPIQREARLLMLLFKTASSHGNDDLVVTLRILASEHGPGYTRYIESRLLL